jgi:Spy/CpxP family protein refolding chaperone
MLFAVIALVVAGCSRTPEQRAECYVKYMVKELKLDDAQKAKLEKIKDEFLAKRPEMIKTREETVKEANELMRSAEIDKARLDALAAKSQTHANDMVGFIASKFTEIHDLLTPDQREKLVAHIEKHMKHGQEKGEPAKSAPVKSMY